MSTDGASSSASLSKTKLRSHSPSVEDYSDLGFGEDEVGLESKLAGLKVSYARREVNHHRADRSAEEQVAQGALTST